MHVFSCFQLFTVRRLAFTVINIMRAFMSTTVSRFLCISANFTRTLGLTDFLHLCQFYLHSQGPYVTCVHISVVVIYIYCI